MPRSTAFSRFIVREGKEGRDRSLFRVRFATGAVLAMATNALRSARVTVEPEVRALGVVKLI